MKKIIGALALMVLGGGCGGGDGLEGVEGNVEEVGQIELALSNTSWADTAVANPFSNPVGASKNVSPNAYVTWTFASDNLTNIRYTIYDKAANTNSAWTLVPGADGLGNGAPGATSWVGCNGLPIRNVAVAWIDPNGNLELSISKSNNATNISASPINLGGGNDYARPALAWANGKLLVITMNAATDNYRYKWADADCQGNITSAWSAWINFPAKAFGGAPAASNVNHVPPTSQVGVIGVASAGCVNNLCPAFITRINVPPPPMGVPTFHNNAWAQIPSTFAQGSALSMAQRDPLNPNGAYVVSSGTTDASMRVAFTSSASSLTGAWSNIGNTNCNPVIGGPTISLQEFTMPLRKFRLNAYCSPGLRARFSTLTE